MASIDNGNAQGVVGQALLPAILPRDASVHFSFFHDLLPQNREFMWLEVNVTRGLSPRKDAISMYLRFSQKFVAILEKLPCQFFRFSLKTSTEPQNTPLNPMHRKKLRERRAPVPTRFLRKYV
jgi:hypothetical protein